MTAQMTPEQSNTLDSFDRVTDWLLRSDGMLFVHVPTHMREITYCIRPDGKSFRNDGMTWPEA